MRIVRNPLFVSDLFDGYAYLAERSPKAASRFLEESERVIELLASFPEIGRARDNLRPGVRSFPLRTFPDLILCRSLGSRLDLLRVVHGARDLHMLKLD